jgi:quercetin dioxygenase-like cupin family protein
MTTEKVAETEDYGVWRITETKGHVIETHFHSNWDETWIIMKGTYKIIIDGEENIVGVGDVLTAPRNVIHRVVATSDECERMAIFKQGVSTIFKVGETDGD